MLGEQSESPDVTEKLREDGCPESGELVQFGRVPFGILGCGFSSFGLGSDSIGSTSSTDPNTCKSIQMEVRQNAREMFSGENLELDAHLSATVGVTLRTGMTLFL